MRNFKILCLGLGLCVTSPLLFSATFAGHIDGVFRDTYGQYFVEGWACSSGTARSVVVDFWAHDEAANNTTPVGHVTANIPREAAITNSCGLQGSDQFNAVGFRFPLGESLRKQFGGTKIIAVPEGSSQRLSNSDILRYSPLLFGWVEGVYKYRDGQVYIRGWACEPGNPNPVKVKVTVDGPPAEGPELQAKSTLVATNMTDFLYANSLREASIIRACGFDPSIYPNARFGFDIPTSQLWDGLVTHTIFVSAYQTKLISSPLEPPHSILVPGGMLQGSGAYRFQ